MKVPTDHTPEPKPKRFHPKRSKHPIVWPIRNYYCAYQRAEWVEGGESVRKCTYKDTNTDRNGTERRNETGFCTHENCPIRDRARNQEEVSRNIAAWRAREAAKAASNPPEAK